MNLAGSTQVEFVTYQNSRGVETWEVFTVRDSQGRELIRATPLKRFAGDSPLPISLDMAADDLFVAITTLRAATHQFVSLSPAHRRL